MLNRKLEHQECQLRKMSMLVPIPKVQRNYSVNIESAPLKKCLQLFEKPKVIVS